MANAQVKHSTVNGINVQALAETIAEVKKDPEMGLFRFRAMSEWLDGAHCRTKLKEFYGAKEEHSKRPTHCIDADEPELLLGTDLGANATEALLHALASCLTATFIYNAAAKQIPIMQFGMDLEGDIDLQGFLALRDDVRRGFQEIRIRFHVKSQASDAQLNELCLFAQQYSPVFDIVTNPTPVKVSLERIP